MKLFQWLRADTPAVAGERVLERCGSGAQLGSREKHQFFHLSVSEVGRSSPLLLDLALVKNLVEDGGRKDDSHKEEPETDDGLEQGEAVPQPSSTHFFCSSEARGSKSRPLKQITDCTGSLFSASG